MQNSLRHVHGLDNSIVDKAKSGLRKHFFSPNPTARNGTGLDRVDLQTCIRSVA